MPGSCGAWRVAEAGIARGPDGRSDRARYTGRAAERRRRRGRDLMDRDRAMRLLLVEDDADIAAGIGEYLGARGIREALGRAYDAGRKAGPVEPVAEADACPGCGERDPDRLEWMNDEDDQVRCASCGFVYSAPSHPANRPDA